MTDLIQLTIRSVQNYCYCPKRWGLMALDCAWMENGLTALGDIVHEKVSDPFFTTVSARRIVERNVPVYCDDAGVYGVVDCLEFCVGSNPRAVVVEKYGKPMTVRIVEYKKSAPTDFDSAAHLADRMQLLTQKICVDTMLRCDCDTEFFYADTKRRRREVFTVADRACLDTALSEMRGFLRRGTIPKRRDGQNCGGCSFRDLCLPKAFACKDSVRQRIEDSL